ncbi:MAG: tRNA 5-methoxyuridine(34)/uridine 5-oxyacetic acid(34) synthase CmoB [Bacteriovoracaceae bacterium]|nr:tRNA 5-methoxyuridine(34)/uridine 5-oxyacetic acid(34) synthase CmoB [Bacteriovoracaceae bacterium]
MPLDYLKSYSQFCDLDILRDLQATLYQKKLAIKQGQQFLSYLEDLPSIPSSTYLDLSSDEVIIGLEDELDTQQKMQLKKCCENLIPWRKGPFALFGMDLDAEWRSDFKWRRLESYLMPLKDKVVLDIGCNNGYFMFKMMAQNPKLIMGFDPTIRYYVQFKLLQHLAQIPSMHFELFGIEHLSHFRTFYDVIFSMGIIYHHRHPIQQLLDMHNALRPGGQLILETMGIPGSDSIALCPADRYAKMPNTWFIPTLPCLINWVKRTYFVDIEVISDTQLTSSEQRLTKWCPAPYQSLNDFLDPSDQNLTLEGYPAPRRFCIAARKRG